MPYGLPVDGEDGMKQTTDSAPQVVVDGMASNLVGEAHGI
jgi:hypothetical protein